MKIKRKRVTTFTSTAEEARIVVEISYNADWTLRGGEYEDFLSDLHMVEGGNI
jgi:hypothetical protein